jgi:putative effector of murein hydrolase
VGWRVNVVVALALTAACFAAAELASSRTGRRAVTNPVLWASALVLVVLAVTKGDVHDYTSAAHPLLWLLSPATVALAAPLAREWRRLQVDRRRLVIASLLGGLAASAAAAGMAVALDAPDELVAALAAKSVTTPIAITIQAPIPVDQGLVAGLVVLAGVYGAVLVTALARPDDPASALGVGVGAHAIGTAEMVRRRWPVAAYGVVGLVLNGVFTSIWLPPVLRLVLR